MLHPRCCSLQHVMAAHSARTGVPKSNRTTAPANRQSGATSNPPYRGVQPVTVTRWRPPWSPPPTEAQRRVSNKFQRGKARENPSKFSRPSRTRTLGTIACSEVTMDEYGVRAVRSSAVISKTLPLMPLVPGPKLVLARPTTPPVRATLLERLSPTTLKTAPVSAAARIARTSMVPRTAARRRTLTTAARKRRNRAPTKSAAKVRSRTGSEVNRSCLPSSSPN